MLYGIFILILILDQLSKYIVVKYLKTESPIVIIKNFLQFHYVENYGAAFGILQNRKIFFLIMTFIVILIIIIFLKRNFYYLSNSMKLALVMLMAGAIGNLIDRIRLGYVIDFISFRFLNRYNFPVFNVADIFVVISTVMIIYMVIFNKYEVSRGL